MIRLADISDMLLVPISPCDNHFKYALHFPFQHEGQTKLLTSRFYKYDILKPLADGLMDADSYYPQGAICTDKLCLFAVLIPRSTWNKIGPMDEGFNTGQSDYDYSLRARDLNIPRLIALDSVVWHFGGATSENGHTKEQREKNTAYFRAKWPKESL
jgi:GT2 family glycosyltransferase